MKKTSPKKKRPSAAPVKMPPRLTSAPQSRVDQPQVGMLFLLPANEPGSPAAHRLNARNSIAVFKALGPPTHWISLTIDPH